MKNIKTINKWIGLFFVTMIINFIVTYLFAIGVNFYADIIRIIANLLNGVSGIYVLYKVFKRDEMVYENETLRTLIYYKEHSRKRKDFPVSMTLLLVYSFLVVANVLYMCMIFYYKYIMMA